MYSTLLTLDNRFQTTLVNRSGNRLFTDKSLDHRHSGATQRLTTKLYLKRLRRRTIHVSFDCTLLFLTYFCLGPRKFYTWNRKIENYIEIVIIKESLNEQLKKYPILKPF